MKFVENQPSDDTLNPVCRMCPLVSKSEKGTLVQKVRNFQM